MILGRKFEQSAVVAPIIHIFAFCCCTEVDDSKADYPSERNLGPLSLLSGAHDILFQLVRILVNYKPFVYLK